MIKTMYSYDGDKFNYDSPEEALEDVWNDEEQDTHEYIIYEGLVHIKKASSYLSETLINTILDNLEYNAYDYLGELAGIWPNSILEQHLDLASRLKILIDDWADEHGLQPTFGEVTNIKRVKFKELQVRDYFDYDYFVEIEDDT